MEIVIPIFPDITALDAVGPYEVLSRLPGAKVRFVGTDGPGPVHTDNKMLALVAEAGIADVGSADILLFPGGFGTRPLMKDEAVLEWTRRIDATTTWTTSVCTGSLVLAGAGLLNGLRATTHWGAMGVLEKAGATPVRDERVVREGKYVTAAGVSSGIDMALTVAGWIAGDDMARSIQLMIEYDPQPPYDSGSVQKAPELAEQMIPGTLLR